jgi:hypothetical protein
MIQEKDGVIRGGIQEHVAVYPYTCIALCIEDGLPGSGPSNSFPKPKLVRS